MRGSGRGSRRELGGRVLQRRSGSARHVARSPSTTAFCFCISGKIRKARGSSCSRPARHGAQHRHPVRNSALPGQRFRPQRQIRLPIVQRLHPRALMLMSRWARARAEGLTRPPTPPRRTTTRRQDATSDIISSTHPQTSLPLPNRKMVFPSSPNVLHFSELRVRL